MPVPKHRISKGRKNRRKQHIKRVHEICTVKCKKCGGDKMAHLACPKCLI